MSIILKEPNTDKGKQRNDNQDENICINVWKNTPLLAVIDGVGGYAGGVDAARIAKKTIIDYVTEISKGDPKRILAEAITHANNKIAEERKINPQFSKMSCVLSVALIDTQKQVVHFGHLGDTRIYIFRDGKLKKITHDHSIVGYREEMGELEEEEAMNHPQRNEILRVLGDNIHLADDENFIETGNESFLPNDMLLLCSDGLTDMITQAEIEFILTKKNTLSEKTQSLINAANNAGGKDNITVVLAEYQNKTTIPIKSNPLSILPVTERITVENTEDGSNEPTTIEGNIIIEKKQNSLVKILLGALLGLLIGAGAMWGFQNKSLFIKKVSTTPKKTDHEENRIRQMIAQNDTISISKDSTKTSITLTEPIILSDTLYWLEKGELILIADSLNKQPAIIIEKGAKVILQNITLKGFMVGIQNQNPTVQLKNVKLENTKTAILNEVNVLPYKINYFKIAIDSLQKP